MSTLEGVGSMMIVAGVLALVATVVHLDMYATFLPIAATSCAGGLLVVRWARRAGQPR